MRSTVARIDLEALRWNLGVIGRKAHGAKVCAMVKANAYGHGMVEVSKTLEQAGVHMLGVALVDEAVQLRRAGIATPILVLTPNEAHESTTVAELGLVQVVGSMEQATALGKAGVAAGTKVEAHLYVDTGMHRDGVQAHDAVQILTEMDAVEGLSITGICTHFATSDTLHDPFLAEQLQRFQRLLAQFQEHGRTFATIHAANTGAVWQAPQAVFTMVRPGLSLYGYAQPADAEVHLRPVMSITSRVLSVRRLWPGETVSYGRRYMTPVETSICTVPIGYGDGYLRSLTGKAHCLIGGNRHPVVGTVCMDELMVDVGNHDVRVGDEVVLLGMQPSTTGYLQSIDAAELASWAGTIAYEITTAISARVPRVFVDGRGL